MKWMAISVLALGLAACRSPERAAPAPEDLDDLCRREVISLHRFFEGWFNGDLENTDLSFERFAGAMAEGFEIVGPQGTLLGREVLIESLRGSHGFRAYDGFRIWIENLRVLPVGEGLRRVVYEEWQEIGGEQRGRLSTGLLRRSGAAPGGVEWLFVFEVWLP